MKKLNALGNREPSEDSFLVSMLTSAQRMTHGAASTVRTARTAVNQNLPLVVWFMHRFSIPVLLPAMNNVLHPVVVPYRWPSGIYCQ